MKLDIVDMDQMGNGIGFIDGKITFVRGAITGDLLEICIDENKKTYNKAHIVNIIKLSKDRIDTLCPYFDKCGGCQLLNMDYEKTLEYKEKRLLNILKPLDLNLDINVVKNDSPFNYRNKIELKMVNKKLGFFENESHNITCIDKCLITKKAINLFLNELNDMNIINADISIRCNYNDELLIIINSKDDIRIKDDYSSYKVVGILLNDKCIYGEDHFMECINNYYFKVSYNSFFQVNNDINSKLFKIIEDNVKGKKVLDLYSGVGTLSIAASKTSDTVYGIEIIPNAALDATLNAKMNKVNNANFLIGKVEDKIQYINDDIDTVIIDPPRKGLDNNTLNFLLNKEYENIIYISCEAQNLVKDLKVLLTKYNLKKIYLLDMFSYTYHSETVCILERK